MQKKYLTVISFFSWIELFNNESYEKNEKVRFTSRWLNFLKGRECFDIESLVPLQMNLHSTLPGDINRSHPVIQYDKQDKWCWNN